MAVRNIWQNQQWIFVGMDCVYLKSNIIVYGKNITQFQKGGTGYIKWE